MMKKGKDEKYFYFSSCIVERIEKREFEKFFYLVGKKKSEMMKNIIYIN